MIWDVFELMCQGAKRQPDLQLRDQRVTSTQIVKETMQIVKTCCLLLQDVKTDDIFAVF